MNDAVESSLVDLLRQHGRDLLAQERRLEGFLRDLHPDDPLEVSVLVEAVSRGVVARLLALGSWPQGSTREVLVAALTEKSGLGLRPAEWSVSVWCQTLFGDTAEGGSRSARQRPSLVSERAGSLRDVLDGTGRA